MKNKNANYEILIQYWAV